MGELYGDVLRILGLGVFGVVQGRKSETELERF